MTTNQGALTLIDDLVSDLQAGESTFARKANTVTAGLGTLITILLGGGTAWLESGTNIPSWLPAFVVALGMAATTFGVSKTKNGMTASVAARLHDELAARIDLNHTHAPIDKDELVRKVVVASEENAQGLVGVDAVVVSSQAEARALELRDEADALVDRHINQL